MTKKIKARKTITVDSVPAKTFADLFVTELRIHAHASADATTRDLRATLVPYNEANNELGPPQEDGQYRLRDVDAVAANIPALSDALDAIVTVLGNLVLREQIVKDIEEAQSRQAKLAEGEDDTAILAEIAAFTEELAPVLVLLGI
jgi:hypothetical protein